MLVKHLIHELQKCNPDSEVITEGCDCTGDTFQLAIIRGAHEDIPEIIEISRSDRYTTDNNTYDNTKDTPHPL
jgi:hypothetical protein